MQSVNQLNVGDKIKVKNLKTFNDNFVFDYFSHIIEGSNQTFEKTQLIVFSRCNVEDGDIVRINEIQGHGWTRYRSKSGYIKYPFLVVNITNLTPPKIEW